MKGGDVKEKEKEKERSRKESVEGVLFFAVMKNGDKIDDHTTSDRKATMTRLRIDLLNGYTGLYMGLCLVTVKSSLSLETLEGMIGIINDNLHYLITHTNQDGRINKRDFSRTVYSHMVDGVRCLAELFGEAGEVLLDENLEYYGTRAVRDLFGIEEITLHIGIQGENRWAIFPLDQTHQEEISTVLQQAGAMM